MADHEFDELDKEIEEKVNQKVETMEQSLDHLSSSNTVVIPEGSISIAVRMNNNDSDRQNYIVKMVFFFSFRLFLDWSIFPLDWVHQEREGTHFLNFLLWWRTHWSPRHSWSICSLFSFLLVGLGYGDGWFGWCQIQNKCTPPSVVLFSRSWIPMLPCLQTASFVKTFSSYWSLIWSPVTQSLSLSSFKIDNWPFRFPKYHFLSVLSLLLGSQHNLLLWYHLQSAPLGELRSLLS